MLYFNAFTVKLPGHFAVVLLSRASQLTETSINKRVYYNHGRIITGTQDTQ